MNPLKHMCKLKGLESNVLAEMLGISKTNISNWTTSDRDIPKKTIPKLSAIFDDIPIKYFSKELTLKEELEIEIFFLEKQLLKEKKQIDIGGIDVTNEEAMEIDRVQNRLKLLKEELERYLRNTHLQNRFDGIYVKMLEPDNRHLEELYEGEHPGYYLERKLYNYLDLFQELDIKKINTLDTIINFLSHYEGIPQRKWSSLESSPNEKLLAFYRDFEDVLAKHNLI